MDNNTFKERVLPSYPILLVDDETNLLHSMFMTLVSEGITDVAKCSDSRKVLSLLKNKRYSIIILDILMPHVRGDELLPQILEEQPWVKVFMLTAVNEVEIAVECMSIGASDYLVKPVEPSVFKQKIKSTLEEVRI